MEFLKSWRGQKDAARKEDVFPAEGQAPKKTPAGHLSPDKLSSKRIPVGSPRELREKAVKLPAVEVKNRVLWVNPAFNGKLPFDLPTETELNAAGKEGKEISTKLGVFLTPAKLESSGLEVEEKGLNMEITLGHNRSGLLGRVIFKDDEGRLYRDVDVKGVGCTFGGVLMIDICTESVRKKDETNAYGILNLQDAYKDRDSTEAFLEKGIRTHRAVAIISLKEIVDENGNKISIKEAKRRGILHEGQKPVLEIRAYGTKMRIADAREKTAVEDAMRLVAQELERAPKTFGEREYFAWFAETLARQVARMHKNGWVHQYLTNHNITLDARVTDLDSVTAIGSMDEATKKSLMSDDLLDAKGALFSFGELLLGIILGSADLRATVLSWTTREMSLLGRFNNKFERVYIEEMETSR